MNLALDVTPARKARIEIIPLIDVIFFLLATFVLFTLSLEKIASIETKFPLTGDPSIGPDSTLYLQASENGTYYWKIGKDAPAEVVMRDELRARLQHYVRSVKEPRVVVRGDRLARFSGAVFALDEIRAVGIKEIAVETMPSATGT
ncbi:MAG: biopolymer transporter ExbD [Verrucomicrobia bacterium]|nr:biopolymer transporter ExbD [Verrucomicrobiota bacterium]